MKTILVAYTNTPLSKKDIRSMKLYCFNVKADSVAVGDMIKSPSYNTAMQVVKILEKAYVYYDKSSGALSDSLTNTNQHEIVEMVILPPVSETGETVFATIL